MSEQEYFKNALSSFTFEAAAGGAIRHLTDLGCTVKQITERLDFPVPYARVQKTVWDHLLDTGLLLLTEPGSGRPPEKAVYVEDHDKYGRISFRKLNLPLTNKEAVCWKETCFHSDGDLTAYLGEKCAKSGQNAAYVSCDFGFRKPPLFKELLLPLNEKQQEYLLGLPWPKQLCYHSLDLRMREILVRLYEYGGYHGTCFFLETGEKIQL